MTYLLGIETSTDVCSVALGAGDKLVQLEENHKKNSHTETITLQIKACLERENIPFTHLSAVIVSEGPGSYTGLRVGVSAAKGLCHALDIPLIGISTLQALAAGLTEPIPDNAAILPMIDARRMEVYTAAFDKEGKCLLDTHNLILKEGVLDSVLTERNLILCGNGCVKAMPLFWPSRISIYPTECSAASLIPLGFQKYTADEFENLSEFDPSYYKLPNVTKPKNKWW